MSDGKIPGRPAYPSLYATIYTAMQEAAQTADGRRPGRDHEAETVREATE